MIDPVKYYSLSEIVELGQKQLFPIKTKKTLLDLIHSGRLAASNVSATDKAVYSIKGEILLAFANSYLNPTKMRNYSGKKQIT